MAETPAPATTTRQAASAGQGSPPAASATPEPTRAQAATGTSAPAAATQPALPPAASQPAATVAPAAATERAEACASDSAHPMAQSIGERYAVTDDDVMIWYCGGSSLEDILLALETNAQTAVPVHELLTRRAQGQSWDIIWQDVGLID